jgi:hypothetical protein
MSQSPAALKMEGSQMLYLAQMFAVRGLLLSKPQPILRPPTLTEYELSYLELQKVAAAVMEKTPNPKQLLFFKMHMF